VVLLLSLFAFLKDESGLAIEELLRRLITLIFAGRNRIIAIRRELPRSEQPQPLCLQPHLGRSRSPPAQSARWSRHLVVSEDRHFAHAQLLRSH